MLLAAILVLGTAYAQEATVEAGTPGHFGAGLVVGDPTGLSLGWRPTEWNAVEVGAGYDILDGEFKTSADYLQSLFVIDPSTSVRIPVYVGLGAGIGDDLGMDIGGLRGGETPAAAPIDRGRGRGANRQEANLALDTPADDPMDVSARVPIGASVLFMNAPIEAFVHVIPSLVVLPDREFQIDGAAGVRYYF